MRAAVRRGGRRVSRVPGCLFAILVATICLGPGAAGPVRGAQRSADPAPEPEAVVRSVVVSGNRRVDAARILQAITHTRPGEPLVREDVQQDLRQILDLGYFRSVSVDVQELLEPRVGSRPPAVRVVFRVEENPVLSGVQLKLQPELADLLNQASIRLDEPRALLPGLKMGEVAHAPTITEELRQLTGRVWEKHGVLVTPGQVELRDDGTLVVQLQGIRVGKVLIEGNEKTHDDVIRRELTVKPGEILLRSELERSLRRVLMLRFFDEVNADLRPGNPGDHVDVAVRVTERRTGMVQLGVSYSGATGLAGVVEVSDINFRGRGQTLELSINHGELDRRYRFSFTEPYLDPRRTSITVSLGYQKTQQTLADPSGNNVKYWDIRYGGELTLGRPLSEYTRGFITFTNNTWAPEAENGGPVPQDLKGSVPSGILRSVTLAAVTDTSDHPFNPTRGDRLRLSAQFAGLGGDFHFTKYETSVSHYIPVRWPRNTHVLAGRLSVGRIVPQGPQGTVPDQERFRVGGSESLRGYAVGQFVGDTMLVASLEYRFPMVRPLWGVLFVDAGNAWGDGKPVDLREAKFDAGFGVRIDVPPLGMIRLDYGMTPESGPQFHFSIGQAF